MQKREWEGGRQTDLDDLWVRNVAREMGSSHVTSEIKATVNS